MNAQDITILVVDDDEGDVELMREAMKDAKVHVNMHTAWNGEEAMKFLRNQPPFQDAPRPDIIFLDLNMPKMDGREVLAAVKADDALKSIPIVVLTTSSMHEDIVKTYMLGVNCFVTKPVGFQALTRVVKTIDEFWFTLVRLPGK